MSFVCSLLAVFEFRISFFGSSELLTILDSDWILLGDFISNNSSLVLKESKSFSGFISVLKWGVSGFFLKCSLVSAMSFESSSNFFWEIEPCSSGFVSFPIFAIKASTFFSMSE